MPKPAKPITSQPQPGFVELRGKSGRLYGYYDPRRQIIEVKRKGEPPEMIDLATIIARNNPR